MDLPRRRRGGRGRGRQPRLRSCCRRCRPPTQVVALDLLLTQIETADGLEVGRIGIEAQIENAPRADRRRRHRGGVAAGRDDHLRAGGLHGVDQHEVAGRGGAAAGVRRGRRLPPHPHVDPAWRPARTTSRRSTGRTWQIRDVEGFRRVAGRSAALGFDGKWVLHPGQVDAANEVFSPRQEDYDHAEDILDAYAWYTSEAGGARGAVMLGDEMIDEASPQDGPGRRRQGPRGRHGARPGVDAAGDLTALRPSAVSRSRPRSGPPRRPGPCTCVRGRRPRRAASPCGCGRRRA